MIFSDHLSHNIVAGDSSNKPTCEGLDLKIHDVYLNASPDKCKSLTVETDRDPVMQALKHQTIKGGLQLEVNAVAIFMIFGITEMNYLY